MGARDVEVRWNDFTGELEFWAISTNTLIGTISAEHLTLQANVIGTVTAP